jgi:hypothetical protein
VAKRWRVGDCVRLADGRIGRVRGVSGGTCKVRVRRKTSRSHQFLMVERSVLVPVSCPKGWMSPEGYARYLKVTLAKMRGREAVAKKRDGNAKRAVEDS